MSSPTTAGPLLRPSDDDKGEGISVAIAHTERTPPGPRGLPLVGVFLRARQDPLRFLMDCARRYGDVASMRLGAHHAYLLSHPDHVKQVLQAPVGAYAKGSAASRVGSLFAGSLTAVDGERWRHRRQQVSHAFHPGQHAFLVAVTTRATAEMLERWRPLSERGEPVDVTREMRRLTQTIMIRAVFGEVPEPEIDAMGEALDVAVAHVDRRLWELFGWLEVPTRADARYRRALGVIDAFVARRVDAARRGGPSPDTVLAALLQRIDDGDLRDELKAILVAGHTTTAAALTWTWLALSKYPEVRRRLEREVEAALDGRPPGVGDLPRLGYARQVIQEVLRLCPPTWLTARTRVGDGDVGGYRLPAGALILLSSYVTHRHPAVWPAPERFDPDRFQPGPSASRPAFAYFPFGGGPRHCIGSASAIAEMLCAVACVVPRYRLHTQEAVDAVPGLTLHPRSPVPALLGPAPRDG